jgi:hypothetical protein
MDNGSVIVRSLCDVAIAALAVIAVYIKAKNNGPKNGNH